MLFHPVKEFSLQHVNYAFQDIVRAISIAGEVLKELAKLGEADQRLVEQKSNEFLGIVKVPLLLCCYFRLHTTPFDWKVST